MEKVLELLQDEAFVAELVKLEKEEDIITLFESRGATVTMNQLRELTAQLPDNAEVSDDDLEKVAGGFVFNTKLLTIVTKSLWTIVHQSNNIWCNVKW